MENKTLKIGIISGIVSSVIVIILINPILSLVWRVVLGVAGSVHQGYVDRIYRNAAVAERNVVGQVTFLLVMMIVLFGTLLLVAWDISSFAIERLPPLVERLPFSGDRFRRVIRINLYVVVIFLSVSLVVIFSISSGVMEINASFIQRLTILAPAIDDAEYKTLRARWASMQTKADYDAIVATMDKRGKELGIALPPVRKP